MDLRESQHDTNVGRSIGAVKYFVLQRTASPSFRSAKTEPSESETFRPDPGPRRGPACSHQPTASPSPSRPCQLAGMLGVTGPITRLNTTLDRRRNVL
jgi:hypothetical protein